MRLSIEVHLDYHFPRAADVLLQIEAAAEPTQRLETQSLLIRSDHPIRAVPGEEGIGQRCWARGEQRLVADYTAVVAIDRALAFLPALPATPVTALRSRAPRRPRSSAARPIGVARAVASERATAGRHAPGTA